VSRALGASQMMDDLAREREILNKSLVKANVATAGTVDLTKVAENTKRNLEVEVAGYQASAANLSEAIRKLTTERERYAQDALDAADRYAAAVDAVKERELTVLQLQKKISEGEAKLKQQQNLYEAVRSDRNLYAKNLIESQEDIAEMKRKFKVNHNPDL
jgi:chromosome segregation ATPase